MRIAIVIDMIAPYTTPVFETLAGRPNCELLVVYETPMEPGRPWQPDTQLRYRHAVLHSWTLDLAPLAVGSGFKTMYDTYLYIPKRPLATVSRFAPDAVVAAGGGVWSSPANIAVLAARAWRGWAFVPWWGSFRRGSPTLPRRLAEPWVKTFIRAGDAWLAYGSRSHAELISLGADPSRIVTSPLVAISAPIGHSKPSRDGASSGTVRYLFVGRLIERKGIDILLDAFGKVEGGELWIVGDGPLAGLVSNAATADERVRHLGHRNGSELHELYRQADALVVPSHYEVWGLVVNEAQAHGLPVIATDQVGAATDLIDPGVNGLVVPAGSGHALADAMREVARWTEDQRARCLERCRLKLEERSVDRAADAIIEACSLGVETRRIRERGPRWPRPRRS